MVRAASYQAWSDLLRYPVPGGVRLIRERVEELIQDHPKLGADLQPMLDYAAGHADAELEEVFTRTFDSNAERALEVGWHLHGENYARGVFMVRMRGLLRDLAIEESSELPDHISHVLGVLAKADDELARSLAAGVVSPALAKIEEGFSDPTNPYHGVVTSLRKYIEGGANDREEDRRDE